MKGPVVEEKVFQTISFAHFEMHVLVVLPILLDLVDLSLANR